MYSIVFVRLNLQLMQNWIEIREEEQQVKEGDSLGNVQAHLQLYLCLHRTLA
jgi:hypothetical protein